MINVLPYMFLVFILFFSCSTEKEFEEKDQTFSISNETRSISASEVAANAVTNWENNWETYNYLDYGYDYFFYQGYKRFIKLIDPQFFYRGIMQSNQRKMDQTDSIAFLVFRFGQKSLTEGRTEIEAQKRIDAFIKGKEAARAYLNYLKSNSKNEDLFIKSVKTLREMLSSVHKPGTFEDEILNPPKLPNNIGSNDGIKIELDK